MKVISKLCGLLFVLLLSQNAYGDDESIAVGASLIAIGGLGLAAAIAVFAVGNDVDPEISRRTAISAAAFSTGSATVGIVVLAYGGLEPKRATRLAGVRVRW